jgi:ABC-type multidrug transport system fused ATPase/permease subunit
MSDLRKKITIIPQDPVLFAGTVRSNLDPFDFHTDEKIWNILDKVGLKKRVEEGLKEKNPLGDKKGKPGAPGGGPAAASAAGANASPAKSSEDTPAEKEKPTLLARVTEKGANFSVGERQLMCLARALLKKSQILLLDEATASVDYEADAMIQRCIRTEFSECTVLTIAHRLATVIDADRVLVLDDGRVAEFDEPYHLLQNQDSIFRSMAVPLGETQFNDLMAKAQAQSEKKKSLPA